jgi:hypothetical protein
VKRAIITYAAGAHEELLHIAQPRFWEFATKHGYTPMLGAKLTERPPAWNKVKLLQHALIEFDEVVWLDADLVIVDTSKDFPPLPEGKSHALVRHFSAMSEVPNTGVWILKKAAIPLLKAMWELEVFTNHGWWEQASLMTLMGYVVPPEGSLFDDTKCRCVVETKWAKECSFMRVEWNSHPNYRAEKPRIVHCSYPDMRTRIDTMAALVKDSAYNYPVWPAEKEPKK